jgi:hypothetical protein
MNDAKISFSLLSICLLAACGQDVSIKERLNEQPLVEIESPGNKTAYDDLHSIDFLAMLGDPNGLDDIASVIWVSNLDGSLMENGLAMPDVDGLSRLSTTLSVGDHTVTVSVLDTEGSSSSDSVTVVVTESDQDPLTEITSPIDLDESAAGVDIQLIAGVEDPNEDADELSVYWSYSNDSGSQSGTIGSTAASLNGTASELWENPPIGNHLVRVTIVDSDGNEAYDEIRLTVFDPDDRDLDGDGWTPNQGDCNDDLSSVHPAAAEICLDGLDNDCSGLHDDKDLDGDLHIDEACLDYIGSLQVDDCNDNDGTIFFGATEQIDGQDNDCDQVVDDGTDAFDDDGDGYSENEGDCDDNDPTLNPIDMDSDYYSTCQGDCDDFSDFLTPQDLDGDGYSTCQGDCDDDDPELQLDDVDGDGYSTCDDDCDDDDAYLTPEDADGDGYSTCDDDCNDNNALLTPVDDDNDGFSTCDGDCNDGSSSFTPIDSDGDGYSSCDGDCDDGDAGLNPIDTDGDGYSTCTNDCDDSSSLLTPEDADNDGHSSCDGDCNDLDASLNLIDVDEDGYSTCDDDCDDETWWTFPGAYEWVDLADNDCDGLIDEGTLAYDDDGDGYSESDGDCDDSNILVSPSVTESCDGIDNNCDGQIDEENAIGCTTYYLDADGDGYGKNISMCLCESNSNYDANNTSDCYDGNSSARPNQPNYFSSHRGDGNFDYDCDNTQEKKVTSKAGTCAFFQDACSASNGWTTVPACGQTGTYNTGCHWDWGCKWSSSYSSTQKCK